MPLGRVALSKQVAQIADIKTTKSYIERHPFAFEAVELAGYRSVLAVPMLKDDELVGSINILGQEVRPFTEKQIELVTNFAAQAVIAIENARLLNELRERTDDLSESLEQQTATSKILEVISNSPTDTQPAFDAIVRSGLNLFPDAVVTISLPDLIWSSSALLAGRTKPVSRPCGGAFRCRCRTSLSRAQRSLTGAKLILLTRMSRRRN